MTHQEAKPPATDDPSSSADGRDLVLVGERPDSQRGFRVLRQREDRFEVGELREIENGKPIAGELVRLHPTEAHERLFECEVLHDATRCHNAAAGGSEPQKRKGPAQVATPAYRAHWDEIFGAKSDQDLN